ncbi:MAG: RagB/SusD family nutrient uptake outer membrane protein [Saprospiraceae bacterium]|nr:RagB/SusD family nutrient uptake outer membrane protein [Saprospiraceae bacterium]
MKKTAIYTIIFILLGLQACTDVLQEDPKSFYAEDAIYATEQGVETAINGIYYSMGAFQNYGSNFHNLMMPHSGLFYSSQQASVDLVGLNANSSNINISSVWEFMYKTINAANVAISNLEAKDESFSNKSTALGHAHFVRGKIYLDLVRMFGGVPLRTKPIDLETIHLARASRQEIIDQVIADLTIAKQLMPGPKDSPNGRPGKWAAHAYLAKLYMTLAVEDPAFWQKAQEELLPIIQSGDHKLMPTYAEIFREGNENLEESILELQYGFTGALRQSDMIRLYTPSNSVFAPASSPTFGRIRPNKEVFDAHFKQYPSDPRIETTFLYNTYPRSNGGTQNIYPKTKTGNNGYACIAKWFDSQYNGTTTERNYIMMRYADVLLMMAEVTNEISGPEEAYTYVNAVLKRARDTNGDGANDAEQPAAWSNMSKETFRDRIMAERRYELLTESEDWFDTRRRGYDYFKAHVIDPHNANPTFDKSRDFVYPDDTKNMLLPIPLTEISGNQKVSAGDQNPGY